MEDLLKQIQDYKEEIAASNANGEKSAEEFRIKWLGSKGLVKNLMGEMKNVANEKKKEFGQILNEFKQLAEAKYEELKQSAAGSPQPTASDTDLTLPGDNIPVGTRHPISLIANRIISIFQRLGFAVAEGPEIEDDWHNFTALNLPEHHPARDMQDTFYVQHLASGETDWLLRTHTSNIQIREMEKGKFAPEESIEMKR
jgi:phenylalanyl-tRNA synthetase alpha chain